MPLPRSHRLPTCARAAPLRNDAPVICTAALSRGRISSELEDHLFFFESPTCVGLAAGDLARSRVRGAGGGVIDDVRADVSPLELLLIVLTAMLAPVTTRLGIASISSPSASRQPFHDSASASQHATEPTYVAFKRWNMQRSHTQASLPSSLPQGRNHRLAIGIAPRQSSPLM